MPIPSVFRSMMHLLKKHYREGREGNAKAAKEIPIGGKTSSRRLAPLPYIVVPSRP
jgi:hypothetical protein